MGKDANNLIQGTTRETAKETGTEGKKQKDIKTTIQEQEVTT